MRTWGRTYPTDGSLPVWTEVTTDQNGFNDAVWIVTLCQVLLLGLGESPFYANYGIPAQQSVLTQVFPDYYVTVTQQQFAGFFTSLIVRRQPGPTPVYDISLVTNAGVALNPSVPVPV
jgi:hypothetical protein